MNKRFLKKLPLVFLFVMSFIAIAAVGLVGLPAIQTYQGFPTSKLDLKNYDLFDLGVADINEDGRLDVFTTNHSARQSILLNQAQDQQGQGQLVESLTALGLDQDKQFPGLEDTLQRPEFSQPGLYIYRYDRELYLHPYELTQPVSGQLSLSWPIEIGTQTEVETTVETITLPAGGVKTKVDFTIYPGGLLSLNGQDDIVELAHTLSIDPAFPTSQIFVGLDRLQPQSNELTLLWRDRHSLSWSDLNRDQKLDVFIGRGGVKGQLAKVPERITDEMMLTVGSQYNNAVDQFGFEKKGCPDRRSAWADFNQDDRLDIYIACGRDDDPVHPNLLYQQQTDGKFVDVSSQFSLDFPEDGTFRWLDFEHDGDIDLLVTRENSIELYLQAQGRFEPTSIVKNFTAKILNLIIADFDADGDEDVYVESKYIDQPNLLLVNENQTYRPVSPATLGLPEAGLGASWVDYDNDGLIDFFNVPNGLYQQTPDHRFRSTRLLDRRWRNTSAVDARSVWADMDNDGDRDLLLAVNQTPALHIRLLNRLLNLNLESHWQKLWAASLHSNNNTQNHWLELILTGSSGNLQAIGTTVSIKTAHTQQTQSVGNIDSAYFSQGHYRLYFGLERDTNIESIEIAWADGQTQKIEDLAADQIWKIQQNSTPVPL